MPDSKITALTALTAADPANDMIPIVDVSDTPPASGNTKRISINNILAASGTATLASATITGDLTVDTSTLKVDSANNRVGIGTASPTDTLDVNGRVTALRYLSSSSNAALPSFAVSAGNGAYNSGTNEIGFSINSTPAMTLNATGLGVGTNPTNKLNLATSSGSCIAGMTNGTNSCQYAIDSTGPYIYSITGGAQSLRVLAPIGSTVFTIDGTGQVGIGVAPSAWAAGAKGLEIGSLGTGVSSGSTFGGTLYASCNAYYDGSWKFARNTTAVLYGLNSDKSFAWFQNSNTPSVGGAITWTQAMTLDASGRLFVGKTSSSAANTGCELQPGTGGNAASVFTADANSVSIMNRLTSDGILVDLRRQTLSVGNISVTTTGATFNSTSDYRLKEAVQPLAGGLARVNALKPSIYKWKSNGSNGEGFLAHELAEVVPFAVTGEKDAVNEDGSIKSQGIDMSRVVPILVAAIQELTARVQTLEAK